ncbi:DNA mismatch repair protein Mlh1p [Trichomonascus vanleenenianus]|uniref:mismatch repair ATPase MLH1 n=1 Tax=Trichomonascus vanleenenianus TaxID=2268995 RepID=UPI003EC9C070
MSVIRPLPEEIINRISAGEIVTYPSSALKELIENSLDAGSTRIDVVVADGGLKSLQITDNGSGIHVDDLPILCHRYTTSKLRSVEDLKQITTYGFRGEALASISYVARVTVVTKTPEAACAYRARYENGKMIGEPVPVAGTTGTHITVTDLFYNTLTRLKALRKNEEYQRIIDVCAKYGIHAQGVAVSCKKQGDMHSALLIKSSMSLSDRIKSYFGSISNELIEVDIPAEPANGLLKANGLITNANYSSKKSVPYVFFINNRLVSCAPMQRAIKQVYAMFLPKNTHAFVYLSIEIASKNIDVNVHPTKREVRFLHEDEIVDSVCAGIQAALSKVDTSRQFKVQTVLPQSVGTPLAHDTTTSTQKRYEYKLVRTDPRQQKITFFTNQRDTNNASTINNRENSNGEGGLLKEYVPTTLRSVKQLRTKVEESASANLTTIFENHTYIGVVDFRRRLAAIQHDVRLYLVDYGAVLKELFYEIILTDFGNFGTTEIDPCGEEPITIRQLLDLAYDTVNPDAKHEIDAHFQTFTDFAPMLEEYFNIKLIPVNGGSDLIVHSLPLLVARYRFAMEHQVHKLPMLFYRIANNADWDDEDQCLDSIARELAEFYTPDSIDEETDKAEADQLRNDLEVVLFPAMKTRLIVPRSLNSFTVEIANLPGLYKVFERC